MELDRVDAEVQAARRLRVRHPERDHLQHLELTRRERHEAGPFFAMCSFVEHDFIVGGSLSCANARRASVSGSHP